ncbi:MAG: NADP-dependent oxidoreductase [Hyphomicrobiales bacterium]|nr:NADP-dependent oxidoreductase [Hyphomicrobiales bacterium]
MRAYVLESYGDAGNAVMRDMPQPAPGVRQILIKVHAAGLNPVDFKFREGKLRAIMRPTLPFVLGNELAGEVIACGPQASKFKPGDRVFVRVAKGSGGAFAEFACVNEDDAARMPASLDFVAAAATPLAALTALQALRDVLKIRKGQRVLISGGAGGVGTFAIQIAKYFGAHVATTASSRGESLVRSLGADEIVDYTKVSIADLPRDFDAGFDLLGGKTMLDMFTVVKPGGTVVSVAGAPEPQTALQDLGGAKGLAALFWMVSYSVRAAAKKAGVRYRFLFMRPSGADLEFLSRMIDDGALRVTVDRVFAFKDIADAFVYLEAGRAKGKVVVTMP